MSPEELQYAIKLEKLYNSQIQSQVLGKLPSGIRKLEQQYLAKEPNLNHYVFLKVNQTQRQVKVLFISDQSLQSLLKLKAKKL